MNVALFVPCYVDQLRPEVAWASVALLEHFGCTVTYDPDQSCCGQPLLNAGDPASARALARRFLRVFEGAEQVVAPSASCVATIRRHYAGLLPEAAGRPLLGRVHELCEFLVRKLGVERVNGAFPRRVGLHPSCHGLRELGFGTGSERSSSPPGPEAGDPAHALLASLEGIELVEPTRRDECCGFGGTFSVTESAVSALMGRDRLRDQRAAGAEVITATDLSCLAHLEGLARRARLPLRVAHVAEILAEALGTGISARPTP